MSTGLDHIKPRAAGGADRWENRAPACQQCDGAKAHYSLLSFLVGTCIAEKKAERRNYRSAGERHNAIAMMRRRIAAEFYQAGMTAAFEKAGFSSTIAADGESPLPDLPAGL